MLDLTADLGSRPASRAGAWNDPERYWTALTEATSHLAAPLGAIDVPALRHNALDLLVRAGGVPIRVASKSVRVRGVLDAVLKLPGFRGILAFTLAEALWLADTCDNVVVGYPTVDRAALARLAADDDAASRVTLMIDNVSQLDLIDDVVSPARRPVIRVALDVDASLRSSVFGHVGVRRSPVFTAAEAATLAHSIRRRKGFRLVGLQMYEAQIAGQPDAAGAEAPLIRRLQAASRDELRVRRAAVASAVLSVAPLEFINGGGTGSLEFTAGDQAVTEVTAGSGLLAGHLFDGYRAFTPAPAAAVAYDVVRRPAPDIVTLLGGGWIASGPAASSRQPLPVWPAGLRMLPREGAGEVQTPVQGTRAQELRIGDRVWMRHAKSGEAAEHLDRYHLVETGKVVDDLLTYRGEGKAFL